MPYLTITMLNTYHVAPKKQGNQMLSLASPSNTKQLCCNPFYLDGSCLLEDLFSQLKWKIFVKETDK